MFRAVVVFCVVLALMKGQITQAFQCSTVNSPLPRLVVIEGCTTEPCEVLRGQDAVISIVFAAPHAIQHMTTKATLCSWLVRAPYFFDESETCNYLSNTTCPVTEGELITSRFRIPIKKWLPGGTTYFEIRVEDEKKDSMTCVGVIFKVLLPANNPAA